MALITQLHSAGAVTVSATYSVGGRFAGYKLNGDGTNTATLLVYDGTDATGNIIIDTQTILGEFIIAPFKCSGDIYFVLGGTGGDVVFYRWDLVTS